jgi:hypothetical protein
LHHVKAREIFDPVEKFTDWEGFQSLASALVSPRIEINSCTEAGKRLRSEIVVVLVDSLYAEAIEAAKSRAACPLGLDRLLKHKQRLGKLWQETRDSACKMALNWVTKTIRRMARKKALERWETKMRIVRLHLMQYGLLRNPSQRGVDQRHQLQFMDL